MTTGIRSKASSLSLVFLVVPLALVSGTSLAAADEVSTTNAGGGYQLPTRLMDERASVKAMVGAISYADPSGTTTARNALGIDGEINLAGFWSADSVKMYYLGVSSGMYYSHLGTTGSNFWGTSGGFTSSQGSNLVLVPVDIKLGIHLAEIVRLSLYGGGNVMYRSVKSTFQTGGDSLGVANSDWSFYPNVGISAEVAVAQGVDLIARPDVTITPGVAVFDGTVGVGIVL